MEATANESSVEHTDMRPLTGLERFALLGAFGWCVEIVFTATMDSLLAAHDKHQFWKFEGTSYLWMHPIYGGGLYLGTVLAPVLQEKCPRPLRLVLGVIICFGIEYVSGWILRATTGVCPWDYSQAEWNVHGLIRLDYAPAWAFLSHLVELLTDLLDRMRLLPSAPRSSSSQIKND